MKIFMIFIFVALFSIGCLFILLYDKEECNGSLIQTGTITIPVRVGQITTMQIIPQYTCIEHGLKHNP